MVLCNTREKAAIILKTLQECAEKLKQENSVKSVLQTGLDALQAEGFEVDYFEFRDQEDLKPLNQVVESGRLFVAAKIENTRLIDNLSVHP